MQGSVQTGLPLAERATRHLRWSAAVSGAFRRAKALPSWHPAPLIFGLRAQRMLSLARRVLNYRLSWPRVDLSVAVTNNTLVRPWLSVGRTNPLISRDSSRQPVAPRATETIWRTHPHHTSSSVETRFEHRLWLWAPALARTQWLPSPASTTSAGLRANNAGAREAGAPEMSTRIAQRLRRVEQPQRSPEPMRASAAPRRGFEETAETPERRLHRDAGPVHRSEPGAGGVVPSGMNVTQLTDEVMRQIDRRLVAFRERMGKI